MFRLSFLSVFILLFNNYLAQVQTGSFIYQEILRDYIVFLPQNYNSVDKMPLVFNLHGYTLNKTQQMNYSQMNNVADTAGFIVVYPNAVETAWNAGINATAGHINDVGFISALMDTLISKYNIDEQKIYSCGFSLGGFMSHRLACELSSRIAAIGDVAGTMANGLLNNFETLHPMPVIKVHGTNDKIVWYNGIYDWAPIETAVNHWTSFNQCVTSDTIIISNIDTLDRCRVQQVRYKNLSDSIVVIFYKILNGGHSWPGGDKTYLTSLSMGPVGNTNMDINASELIWNFFRKYKLTIPVKVEEFYLIPFNFTLLQNYPNPFNPLTTIKYSIPRDEKRETRNVKLDVFDLLGSEVTTLVNEKQKPGNYEVSWDGSKQPSGVYFYRLICGHYSGTKKMILLK